MYHVSPIFRLLRFFFYTIRFHLNAFMALLASALPLSYEALQIQYIVIYRTVLRSEPWPSVASVITLYRASCPLLHIPSSFAVGVLLYVLVTACRVKITTARRELRITAVFGAILLGLRRHLSGRRRRLHAVLDRPQY